jgi:citrate synthase
VEGRLRYRGIDVEDVVARFRGAGRLGFHEVVYLLLLGRYPNVEELAEFDAYLGERRELPEGFTENMILKAPSPDVMNKLARSVLAAYSYDPNPDELTVPNVLRQCLELVARFPVMVAYGYQAKRHYYDGKSLFIHRPDRGLSIAEDFLALIRPDGGYTPIEAETLDLALVLHAEHGGGNNSAFTVHVVSSSDTDTYSAMAAAVGSLRGPKHGGANQKVVEMMDDIRAEVGAGPDEGRLRDYLSRILRREAFDRSGLIYGMGHAVYTISDPRTTMLRAKAQELAREKGRLEEYEYHVAV